MDILLTTHDRPQMWLILLATAALVITFVVLFFSLAEFFEDRGRRGLYNAFSIFGCVSFLVLPFIFIGVMLHLRLPDPVMVTKGTLNEESLNEQAQKKYGYELVEEAESHDFEQWEQGVGVYIFQPKDEARKMCAVQTDVDDRNGSFNIGEAPLSTKGVLSCKENEPDSDD